MWIQIFATLLTLYPETTPILTAPTSPQKYLLMDYMIQGGRSKMYRLSKKCFIMKILLAFLNCLQKTLQPLPVVGVQWIRSAWTSMEVWLSYARIQLAKIQQQAESCRSSKGKTTVCLLEVAGYSKHDRLLYKQKGFEQAERLFQPGNHSRSKPSRSNCFVFLKP